MSLSFKSGLRVFAFVIAGCTLPSLGQTPQQTPVSNAEQQTPGDSVQEQSEQQVPGSISGTVVDRTGAVVAGARVKLTRENQSPDHEIDSDADGEFVFANIMPGAYQLTITLAGFATQTSTAALHSGENLVVPPITLAVATANTELRVVPSTVQVAEDQIKEEEQQRVLAVIPNFYVSYIPNAAPLNPRQKFQLAWKSSFDPVNFAITGLVAGIQQAQNDYPGYGQGAQGYGKRYGAAFADSVSGTFISGAILPALLKQDPRYFYKGTGTTRSRFFYAMANAVICKGDNGRWQPNYSNILGSLASGGISNAYYPETDRGVGLTFENALIGVGSTAIANVFQEFVVKKFTPHASKNDSSKP